MQRDSSDGRVSGTACPAKDCVPFTYIRTPTSKLATATVRRGGRPWPLLWKPLPHRTSKLVWLTFSIFFILLHHRDRSVSFNELNEIQKKITK